MTPSPTRCGCPAVETVPAIRRVTAGIHPIEAESYRILAERASTCRPRPPGRRRRRRPGHPRQRRPRVRRHHGRRRGGGGRRRGRPAGRRPGRGRRGDGPRRHHRRTPAVCFLAEARGDGDGLTRSAGGYAPGRRRAIPTVPCSSSAAPPPPWPSSSAWPRPATVGRRSSSACRWGSSARPKSKDLLRALRAAGHHQRGEKGGSAVAGGGGQRPGEAEPVAEPRPASCWSATAAAPRRAWPSTGDLATVLRQAAPGLDVGCGFIELAEPDLDDRGSTALVAAGATSVVAVPLVLLGAGHMKDDGPAALHRARQRHPGVRFALCPPPGHPPHGADRGRGPGP